MALENLYVAAGSIDSTGASVETVEDGGELRVVARLDCDREDTTPEETQYLVSVLFWALNDNTKAASTIRAKARADVKKYVS